MATIYTIEMRDALKVAIAQGVQEVYYGDKRVVYRSLSEMRSILAEMNAELGVKTNSGRKYAEFNKGLC